MPEARRDIKANLRGALIVNTKGTFCVLFNSLISTRAHKGSGLLCA